MCVGGDGCIRCCYQQPPGHAQVNDPLGRSLARSLLQNSAARRAGEVEDDVLSAAANSTDGAAFETASLPCCGSFQRFTMGTEPGLEDAVAPQPGVDAARNGLYLGQFGHPLILEDARPRVRESRLTLFFRKVVG